MRKTVAILGIPVDDVDAAEALGRIEQFIASGTFHQVATANTDFLVQALDDLDLRRILREADLVLADGMPLVLASRLLGAGLRERVAGADLVPRLAFLAARKGYRVFMLGARPEVAARARQRLEAANPGLQIVGCLSPPIAALADMDHEGILAEIAAVRPDILLVALGNPKQEKWIATHRQRLAVPVCIGVGGTFDFVAGSTARAPVWMQRAGMEWLHRTTQEPWRLGRRYAQDAVHFARLMAVQLWVMRKRRNSPEARVLDARLDGITVISVTGPLDLRSLPRLQVAAERALTVPTHLLIDLEHATTVDSSVLGTVLNLRKRAAYVEREVRLIGLHGRVARAFSLANASESLRVHSTLAEAVSPSPAEPSGAERQGAVALR